MPPLGISRYYWYIIVSNVATILFALDAVFTFRQYFPAVVYLTSSRTFGILVANTVGADILLLGSVIRKLFFGKLSALENQRVHEELVMQFFHLITAMAFFQSGITATSATALILCGGFKLFHVLAVCRLEDIERSANRPTLQIRRLAVFLLVAFVVDLYYLISCATHIFERGVNIYLVFCLEFSVMALAAWATSMKLLLFLSDDGSEGRGPIRFYLDIVCSVVECTLYVAFFSAMLRITFPIHMVRDLLQSIRTAATTLRNFAKYRKLAADIDKSFAAATTQDLEKDRRCAVCYDDMQDNSGCKRLPCGHCYHRHCLRKWFEQHSSCPYCRKEIETEPVRPAWPPARREQPPPANPQQQPQQQPPLQPRDEPQQGQPNVNPAPREVPVEIIIDESALQEAYQMYLRLQQQIGTPSSAQHAEILASAAASHAAAESSQPAVVSQEGQDDIQSLRQQLEAYKEYRKEVELASTRLEMKLKVAMLEQSFRREMKRN